MAIKGMYVIFGVVLSYTLSRSSIFSSTTNIRNRWLSLSPKITIIVISIIVSSISIFDVRTAFVYILVPIGAATVVLSLDETRKKTSAILIIMYYLSIPYSKYVRNGFYFGNSDIIFHTKYVKGLISAGRVSGMVNADIYRNFPGLHLTVSAIANITSLPPYDSLMILGMFSFAVGALIAFSIYKRISGTKVAVFGLIGFLILRPSVFYSSYFFPEAFAYILFLTWILTLHINYKSLISRILPTVLLISIVFTHHLLALLVIPILASLMLFRERDVYYLQGLAYFLASLFHISVNSPQFIIALSLTIRNKLDGVLLSGRSLIVLGNPEFQTPLEESIGVLMSWQGVYAIILTAVLLSAFYIWVSESLTKDNLHHDYALFATGVIGIPLMLPTPGISFGRINLIFVLSMAYMIGIAINNIRPNGEINSVVIVLLLFFSLTAAPIIAADDIELGGSQYTQQKSFSDSQVQQLDSLSKFSKQYTDRPSTFWIFREYFSYLGVDNVDSAEIKDGSINHSSKLIYSEDWGGRRIIVRDNEGYAYVSQAIITEEWLESFESSSNKIYSNGEMGVLD